MLKLTARKAPEVVIKISGGGRSTRSIKNHFNWRLRNGKLELEDQEMAKKRRERMTRDLRRNGQSGKFGISDKSHKERSL